MGTPIDTTTKVRIAMSIGDLSASRDRDLVSRLRSRDEEAFRALFRRYAPTALALARRLVRHPGIAEEVVQEAFLAVWQSAELFDAGRGSARSWVMSIVHHRAVDAVRREEAQRRRSIDVAATDDVVVDDPTERLVEDLDLPQERKVVRAALDELPAEQRQVIELMYFDGLSQSNVAERLSLPLGTVKSRTVLGMRKLRTVLARAEP